MLIFMYCPKPVFFFRNKDLKTGAFTRYTGFFNVDPRYFKDLPGKDPRRYPRQPMKTW